MPELLIGRLEIMAALRVTQWRTILRWKKKYGIKFLRMPNGRPAILKGELIKYLDICDKNRP